MDYIIIMGCWVLLLAPCMVAMSLRPDRRPFEPAFEEAEEFQPHL